MLGSGQQQEEMYKTLGRTKVQFKLGVTTYTSEFLVCRNLRRTSYIRNRFS